MRIAGVIHLLAPLTIAAAPAPAAANGALPERVTCSLAAAVEFGIAANLLLAIAEVEGGRVGQRVRNTNATFDIGPLQFNTRYLAQLEASYGITEQDVNSGGCYPYRLAAYRLQHHLAYDAGSYWRRAANYHSRTLIHNERYQKRIKKAAQRWLNWIRARYPTGEPVHSVTHAPPLPTARKLHQGSKSATSLSANPLSPVRSRQRARAATHGTAPVAKTVPGEASKTVTLADLGY